MKELLVVIFVDSNHVHDKVSGKSVTLIIGLIGRTPVTWISKRQSLVKISKFGDKLISLERAWEEVVTYRYYLRSFRCMVSKPCEIYENITSVVINSTDPGSVLHKNYIYLSYQYYR